MWRRRQWRLLLGLIDNRSTYSYLSHALSQDEELAQQAIDHAHNTAELDGGKQLAPPLYEWSQTNELLRRLISEVEAVKIVTIRANSKKGSRSPEPRPVNGPTGVMSKLLKRKRWENHKSLRARLLPGKYGDGAQETEPAQESKEAKQWDPRSPFVRRR